MKATDRGAAVLCAIQGYHPEQVEPFFRSLRATGYNGRVICFLRRVPQDSVSLILKYGGEVVRGWARGGMRNSWERFWPLGRLLVRALPGSSNRSRVIASMTEFMVARFMWYYDWLREERGVEKLLITDVRDVYFQSNPLHGIYRGLHSFEEDRKIGDCPVNSEWLRCMFGPEVTKRLAEHAIVCAGTIIGERAAVLGYLEEMIQVLLRNVRRFSIETGGNDQGIYNYIVHEKLVHGTIVHPNGEHVLTVGAGRYPYRIDEGILQDRFGRPIPIVHQYDRLPSECVRQLNERWKILA